MNSPRALWSKKEKGAAMPDFACRRISLDWTTIMELAPQFCELDCEECPKLDEDSRWEMQVDFPEA